MASIRRDVVASAPALEGGSGFRRYVALPPEHTQTCVDVREAAAEPMAHLQAMAPIPVDAQMTIAAAGDALRFRAALRETFECEIEGLCADLAARVLVRELRLSPANISALAREVLAHRTEEPLLALRTAPEDHPRLVELAAACDLTLHADASLQPGSVALDLRSGTLESTLELRLDAVLSAHQASQ